MRPPASPLARRATTDIVRFVIIVSVFLGSIVTVEHIQYLQSVLDGFNCCISDVPMLFARTPLSISSSLHRFSPSPSGNDTNTISSCLQHLPLYIDNALKVELNSSTSTLLQPSTTCGTLRRNWAQNPLQSPLAKAIEAAQTNCSLPIASYHMDNDFGFGSHLNVWSQAMCNVMESSQRLQTYNPTWIWMDQTYCSIEQARESPLLCYFPLSEQRCSSHNYYNPLHIPNNSRQALSLTPSAVAAVNVTDPRNVRKRCALVQQKEGLANFRAASMEYLFQRVSPLVLQEAQRQIGLLFGENHVPDNLITVHMRWGDKFWEMDLPSEHEYVAAVVDLLNNKDNNETNHDNNNRYVNIYLATEDPRAVQAFTKAAPKEWNIYIDRTVAELNEYRPNKGNRASWTTKNTRGRAGLVALGSLLVALEANLFVLTTQSNWSRLLNELRTNIIDPQCGQCTKMIDLRPGQW
jgi:hypothetical protein